MRRIGAALGRIAAREARHMQDRLARSWKLAARPVRADRPLASFTFDDIPRSAATEGARILEDHGHRASFYVCGGLEGREVDGIAQFRRDDLPRLAGAGHEIGCHGFSHARFPELDAAGMAAEIARNRAWLAKALPGHAPRSFAYPYGHASIASKRVLHRHYPVVRGVRAGVNGRLVDFQQLRCVLLERRVHDRAAVLRLLEAAARRRAWVVFLSHDISPDPSPYGVTPAELAEVAQAVTRLGFEVLPVAEAAAKLRAGQVPARQPAPGGDCCLLSAE